MFGSVEGSSAKAKDQSIESLNMGNAAYIPRRRIGPLIFF